MHDQQGFPVPLMKSTVAVVWYVPVSIVNLNIERMRRRERRMREKDEEKDKREG